MGSRAERPSGGPGAGNAEMRNFIEKNAAKAELLQGPGRRLSVKAEPLQGAGK